MNTQENTGAIVPTSGNEILSVAVGGKGLQVETLDQAFRLATCIAKSGLAPKGIQTPEAILTAMQLGFELGLPPMAALQNIAVINGRPGLFGDAALALVRGSGLLEAYAETEIETEAAGDAWGMRASCTRKDFGEASETFTVADAKRAKLWGKQGPWTEYPRRMLKWRARGFLLRDFFGDVLKGMRTVEEMQDIPETARPLTSPGGTERKPAGQGQAPKVIEAAAPEAAPLDPKRKALIDKALETDAEAAAQGPEPFAGEGLSKLKRNELVKVARWHDIETASVLRPALIEAITAARDIVAPENIDDDAPEPGKTETTSTSGAAAYASTDPSSPFYKGESPAPVVDENGAAIADPADDGLPTD